MKIDHPYNNVEQLKPLRGNLHAHTTRSDGASEPQAVIDDYAKHGYDFLMISDHDTLTTEAEHAAWDDRGMVLVPGNEITKHGPHMLHVNCATLVPPHDDRQQAIDHANADRGFVIVAHPNWQALYNHASIELLHQWQNYTGIEIFNGVIGRLQGRQFAADKWDQLLAAGRRVWGFANDDSHRPGPTDVALGWNMVWADDRSAPAVVQAMHAGRFYASTGVTIDSIQVNDSTIHIHAQNADRIVAIYDLGKRFAFTDDNKLEITVPDDATYVRFECYGRAEQIAWTQPFFISP